MINLRWTYQAPIAAIKWVASLIKKIALLIFNVIKTVVLFVCNLIKRLVLFILNTISATYMWIETKLKMINARFWVGIGMILASGYMFSLQPKVFLEFVMNHQIGGVTNNMVMGLFLVASGLICIIFSVDYSKFRLWGNK